MTGAWAAYDRGIVVAARLSAEGTSPSDLWALKQGLAAFRAAPDEKARAAAARRIAEQVGFIEAAVFALTH